jgi:RNA polymerase sigma-70 factor (ECF subfamily)
VDPATAEWVAKAREGDAAAFDRIVRTYASPLVRFTTSVLGGDLHAAHDVVQDAFLVAWRTLPSLVEPRFFRAWLYRVAYHRAISWLRRRGPHGSPFHALGTDAQGGEPSPCRGWGISTSPDPTDEVTPRLHAALSALPLRYAAPISLYYFQGLGTRETAEALGLSRATVKMRLLRGRSILRHKLQRVAGEGPACAPTRARRAEAAARAAPAPVAPPTSPPATAEGRPS